jgi:hypothetical protein
MIVQSHLGFAFLFQQSQTSIGIATSDYTTGWTAQGLNPGRGKGLFSFPKHPDWLWGPLILIFNG